MTFCAGTSFQLNKSFVA